MSAAWSAIVVAGIAAVASVSSAAVTALVWWEIRTSNGHTLGETVEHAHGLSADTNAKVTEAAERLADA